MTQTLLEDSWLRRLLDPVTLLLILGVFGFFEFYGIRFLLFVALAVTFIGIWAVSQKRWEIAIPIQTFFLGTWAYNLFEGRSFAVLGIMVVFLLLLGFGFWTTLGRPPLKSLSLVYTLYLMLATLIVWQIAVLIQLFWGVEPWSRTFLVVAALVFFQTALDARLKETLSPKLLLVPLIVIVLLSILIIVTTPIPRV